jgi:hypothetical protein
MPQPAAKLVPIRRIGQVPEIIEVHYPAAIYGGRFRNPAGQAAWKELLSCGLAVVEGRRPSFEEGAAPLALGWLAWAV